MSGLFESKLTCAGCGAGSTPRRRQPGEPVIVSINLSIYRNGKAGRTHRAAGRVSMCDRCLIKALAEPKLWESMESRRFLSAIREAISSRYNVILRDDQEVLPGYAAQDSRELARELFGGAAQ